jgi:hypothetical protein
LTSLLGHHHVEDDQINIVLLDLLKSFASVIGDDRLVAILAQHHGHKLDSILVVIDN